MSARRIKIKRRHARERAAAAHSSPITPSGVFGSSAVDPDAVDNLYSELEATEEGLEAEFQEILRDLKSASAARRSLCAATAPSPASVPDAATPAPILPAPGHSTGPRTTEGKARSSQNAMKHGLTITAGAALVFLSSKEADAHVSLSVHFTQQFVPMTGAEREIVCEITDALSLARRARDLQTSALMNNDDRALALYLRYETAHLRAHNAAIKTLLVLQKDRRQRNENHEKWNEPVHWGEYTFVSDDDFSENGTIGIPCRCNHFGISRRLGHFVS